MSENLTLKAKNKLKIFIIAGEASGDLLGARLMNALHQLSNGAQNQTDENKIIGLVSLHEQVNNRKILEFGANQTLTHPIYDIEFQGIGGDGMEAVGLKSLFPIKYLSIAGLFEVLPHIFKIKRMIKQTVLAINAFDPDIIITIDSPGFNLRVIKKLKASNIAKRAKKIHYVAPTVWAWKPERSKIFAKYYDLMLTLFPFEATYFEDVGLPAHFVGHSVLETKFPAQNRDDFIQKHKIQPNANLVLILPGSREGEVKRHLPIFHQSLDKMRQLSHMPLVPIILTLPHLRGTIEKISEDWAIRPVIIDNSMERFAAMAVSEIALAASGTISLELAMAALPHIVAYRINKLSYKILRNMVNTPYVNLVNILNQKLIIPECLQDDCKLDILCLQLLEILSDNEKWEVQMEAFQTALVQLQPKSGRLPSIEAAASILETIKVVATPNAIDTSIAHVAQS